MGARPQLTVAEHLQRADRHQHIGNALMDAGDEWAVVMFFYSAYHVMKAAFLGDPIFDDPTRLSRVSPSLSIQDRYVDRHTGRRKPEREWGVNDLVGPLYGREAMAQYELLHAASIDVRYYHGLTSPLEKAREACEWIRAAYDEGRIGASTAG